MSSPTSDSNFVAIERAIAAYLSHNLFNSGTKPDYGIAAERVSPNGHEVEIAFTFKRGIRYCCYELGCHLDLHSAKSWERLWKLLRQFDADLLRPLCLHVRVIVEDGALFMENFERGDDDESPPSFKTSAAYQFEHDFEEVE